MRWFKHISSSSDDEFICGVERKFGIEGYARHFKLIERVALGMNPENPEPKASFAVEDWCRFLKCKRKILLTFLEHYQNVSKIFTQLSGNVLTIIYPKVLEYKDEYLQRSGQTPESHPTKIQIQKQSIEADTKEPPKPPVRKQRSLEEYPPAFEVFWNAYPKKKAKGKALLAWQRINPQNGLREKILSSVAEHSKSHEWTKDGGQYIPHPSTFLHQRCWEDELDLNPGSAEIDMPKIDLSEYNKPMDPRKVH